MKLLRDQARAKRVAQYGEEVEPEYSGPIEGLRQQMLDKIGFASEEDEADDEEVPPAESLTAEDPAATLVSNLDSKPAARSVAHISVDGNTVKEDVEAPAVPVVAPKPVVKKAAPTSRPMIEELDDEPVVPVQAAPKIIVEEPVYVPLLPSKIEELDEEEEKLPVAPAPKKEAAKATIKASRQLLEKVKKEVEEDDCLDVAPAADES
jgi:hypothetical protein